MFPSSGDRSLWPDRILTAALGSSALGVAIILALIIAFVAFESWPALSTIGAGGFFAAESWHPPSGRFGIVPLLIGSLLVTCGAVFLAAPTGILMALFQCYYAPRHIAGLVRRVIELLNGIPSVVFGFWGLVTLVPLLNHWQPPGHSLLAGILVLTPMILPTVALTATSALRSVDADHERSATALGMGRWATIRHVVLPQARRGIAGGTLLAAARAIGETMAVLMVCGNIVQVPDSLFDPVRPITANIALEMGYATADHRSALFATGFFLLALIALALVLVHGRPGNRSRS